MASVIVMGSPTKASSRNLGHSVLRPGASAPEGAERPLA